MFNKMDVHFSSQKDDWATPQEFFDFLNKYLGPFELDPSATMENAKCPKFFTEETNGLIQTWSPYRTFMNPPYGRNKIEHWVKKAFNEAIHGGTRVVCLLPARPGSEWFHDYCMKGQIGFVKGRLKFVGAPSAAPFPSMIVIFDGPSLGAVFSGQIGSDSEKFVIEFPRNFVK